MRSEFWVGTSCSGNGARARSDNKMSMLLIELLDVFLEIFHGTIGKQVFIPFDEI